LPTLLPHALFNEGSAAPSFARLPSQSLSRPSQTSADGPTDPVHAIIPALQTSQYLKARFNVDFDEVAFTRIKEERYEQNMEKAKPIEPVIKIIRENKGKLPMACGTGGSQYLAWKTLEIAGVKDCFEYVVAAEDVINHKPFPDTFLKAAELIGVQPSDCEVFEDGQLGLQAAASAGMMFVDVTPFYDVNK